MNGDTGQIAIGKKQEFDASSITRPADSLLVYYLIVSLCTLVAFPLVFTPLFIRFKTMRYRFDDTGVSMQKTHLNNPLG